MATGRRTVRTMCPMNCHPTLCGMLVTVEDGRLLEVAGDPDNPDSRGFLCVRGHASREILDNPKRLLHPLVRDRRDAPLREAGWDEALDRIADRMRAVGREALGLWSGHGFFATNYGVRVNSELLRRFANLWGCQWWAPTMICWGLGGFGIGLTGPLETNTKEDMGAHAELILLWGANLASQPNTAPHLVSARRRGAHVVTIDVRRTEAVIVGLARRYAATRPAMILLGGSSMHKGANGWQGARAVACLPALTGNLGIAGGGLGPRHGSKGHGHGLADIAETARRPPGHYVPNQMPRITEALEDRRVRALLLFGTDMLSSFADIGRVERALARQDLIVVQDLFLNDTARRFADVVLPGTAWVEELGCKATNTHLYLMEPALAPAGQTRPGAWVLRELARRLEVADFYPWAGDEGPIDAILDHPATGHATVAALRAEGGMWALRVSHVGHPDLVFPTPSGKVEFYSSRARDLGLPPLPVHEPLPASSYPLVLRQGRTLAHFHGFYDHGRALPSLAALEPEPVLWISAADATARGVGEGARIRVFNQRGEMASRARVTDRVPTHTVWMRDGWDGLNRLTSGEACLPDGAVDVFGFSAGQAAFDAAVEVAPA